jgi:hypothetical protein
MSATPCGHCGTTVRHGERIGCCSGCGRLFSSNSAHDRHRRDLTCQNPESVGLVAKEPKGHPGVVMWAMPATGREWWAD